MNDLPNNDDFVQPIDKGGELDNTPLRFGKFKGKTPEWISENGIKGDSYLIWAYETVADFPVCSDALYRSIGGKGTRAIKQPSAAQKAKAEYEARKAANRDDVFDGRDDEYSDDIPF